MSCADWRFCPRCAAALPPLEAAPRRCAAPGCNFEFWNHPRPVVAVIAETVDGVVLAHRRAWPVGMFAPLTGYCGAGLALIGAYSFAAANQLIVAGLQVWNFGTGAAVCDFPDCRRSAAAA